MHARMQARTHVWRFVRSEWLHWLRHFTVCGACAGTGLREAFERVGWMVLVSLAALVAWMALLGLAGLVGFVAGCVGLLRLVGLVRFRSDWSDRSFWSD